MWVKLDSENYYADCYMEGDPDINPFVDEVNAVYVMLPSELGNGRNRCYKLITNSEGEYEAVIANWILQGWLTDDEAIEVFVVLDEYYPVETIV